MLDAGGPPAGGQHLHLHPSAADRTEPWRLKRPGRRTRFVIAIGEGAPAAVTPPHSGRHRVADRALTGIFRSASMARSAEAGRPSVVR